MNKSASSFVQKKAHYLDRRWTARCLIFPPRHKLYDFFLRQCWEGLRLISKASLDNVKSSSTRNKNRGVAQQFWITNEYTLLRLHRNASLTDPINFTAHRKKLLFPCCLGIFYSEQKNGSARSLIDSDGEWKVLFSPNWFYCFSSFHRCDLIGFLRAPRSFERKFCHEGLQEIFISLFGVSHGREVKWRKGRLRSA